MEGTKDNGKQRSYCVVMEIFDYDDGYKRVTMGMRKHATQREALEAAGGVADALAETFDAEAKFGWGGYEIHVGSDCRHLEGIYELNKK